MPLQIATSSHDTKNECSLTLTFLAQVGSGKSSLVSAMLGEMTKVAGEVTIDGSVAYVAQTAWIINATLKENVLMGKPFDSTRYEEVLRVCDMQQVRRRHGGVLRAGMGDQSWGIFRWNAR